MNVNLQIIELEQHIYGMMDVGRGITKDRHTIYLIHAVHTRLCGARSGSPQLLHDCVDYACMKNLGKKLNKSELETNPVQDLLS